MRKKGFTLVELLVVIAIIALLMGILMPALARVRQMAYRMACGANLSGIGKAMVLYAQDNEGDYPRSGGRNNIWSTAGFMGNASAGDGWDALTETAAFSNGTTPATIGSSLYLLVKYADVGVKQFVCKGDIGTETFKLSDYKPKNSTEDIEAWDFGRGPGVCNSYSYQMPFSWTSLCGGIVSFPASTTSSPSMPVCADRNPYLDKNAEGADNQAGGYVDGQISASEIPPSWDAQNSKYVDRDKTSNAAAHQREGQNVLYADISTRFQLQPNCGISNDNIWKHWITCPPGTPGIVERQMGALDTGGAGHKTGIDGPLAEADAYLVNEHQGTAQGPP